MAFYRPRRSTLIVLIILTIPFLDIIVDINCGDDDPLHSVDLRVTNTRSIGCEDIPVFFSKFVFETTHFEREHVHPVQGDRAPPSA